MDNQAQSDAQLVQAALQNKEVFGELIDRYEPKLRRYIGRITNVPPQDIDDLLQDTFIKAYQNLNGYDGSYAFSSWLYRIARNTTISAYRKRSARPEALILDDDEYFFQLADEMDIERSAITAEDRHVVGRALMRLKDDYRDVLVLRFFEEKSYEEISDIMKKPMGTVSVLLSRAKQQLRTELTTTA